MFVAVYLMNITFFPHFFNDCFYLNLMYYQPFNLTQRFVLSVHNCLFDHQNQKLVVSLVLSIQLFDDSQYLHCLKSISCFHFHHHSLDTSNWRHGQPIWKTHFLFFQVTISLKTFFKILTDPQQELFFNDSLSFPRLQLISPWERIVSIMIQNTMKIWVELKIGGRLNSINNIVKRRYFFSFFNHENLSGGMSNPALKKLIKAFFCHFVG